MDVYMCISYTLPFSGVVSVAAMAAATGGSFNVSARVLQRGALAVAKPQISAGTCGCRVNQW